MWYVLEFNVLFWSFVTLMSYRCLISIAYSSWFTMKQTNSRLEKLSKKFFLEISYYDISFSSTLCIGYFSLKSTPFPITACFPQWLAEYGIVKQILRAGRLGFTWLAFQVLYSMIVILPHLLLGTRKLSRAICSLMLIHPSLMMLSCFICSQG